MNCYVALAVLIQLLLSTIPAASQLVIDHMPVEPYIALRYTIAAAIFGLLALYKKTSWAISSRDIIKIGLLGIAGYAGASLGTLYGLKLGGVTIFGLIALTNPVIVMALSIVVLKEHFGRYSLIACLLSVIGILLTIYGRTHFSNSSTFAIAAFCIIGAYTFDTLVFLKSKKFKARVPLVQYIFIAQTAAAIFMWCVCLLLYPTDQLLPLDLVTWGWVNYVAILSCVIGFFVWYWLLGFLEGQQLGFYFYIHGLFAALWGVIFFGDSMSLSQIAGSLFFLGSIFAISKGPQPKPSS